MWSLWATTCQKGAAMGTDTPEPHGHTENSYLRENYTEEELVAMREQYVAFFEQPRRIMRNTGLPFAELEPRPAPPCTCDTCSDRHRCTFAYDVYNTDGDCILMK